MRKCGSEKQGPGMEGSETRPPLCLNSNMVQLRPAVVKKFLNPLHFSVHQRLGLER